MLHFMARRNDLIAVQWLLDHGAAPNTRVKHSDAEETPLHLAVLEGNAEVVRALPKAGADPRTLAPANTTAMPEVGPSTVVDWNSCEFSMRTMAKNWFVNAYSNVVRETNPHDRGAWMNYSRIALAALGATVAYFVLGGILFSALPSLQKEFMKYPAVYRTQDDMKRVMPMGMIAILVEIVVVTVLYVKAYPAGGGVLDGARFGHICFNEMKIGMRQKRNQ